MIAGSDVYFDEKRLQRGAQIAIKSIGDYGFKSGEKVYQLLINKKISYLDSEKVA